MSKFISKEEIHSTISRLEAMSPSLSGEQRLINLAIRYLRDNAHRTVRVEEICEYIDMNIFEPNSEEKYAHWVAFGVGFGIGYAATYLF